MRKYQQPVPECREELVKIQRLPKGCAIRGPIAAPFPEHADPINKNNLRDQGNGSSRKHPLRLFLPIGKLVINRPRSPQWQEKPPEKQQSKQFIPSLQDDIIPAMQRGGEKPKKESGCSGAIPDQKRQRG